MSTASFIGTVNTENVGLDTYKAVEKEEERFYEEDFDNQLEEEEEGFTLEDFIDGRDVFDNVEEDNDKDSDDDELIEYCRSFVNSHFYGETTASFRGGVVASERKGSSGKVKAKSEDSLSARNLIKKKKRKISFNLNLTTTISPLRKFSAPVKINQNGGSDSLATILKIFHLMLTSHSSSERGDLQGTEDAIFQYLIVAAALRKRSDEKLNSCFKRLLGDCKRFLQIYNKEAATQYDVSDQHWGTCQQLRCGKIIVDHLDVGAPTMDPIFGVLLCPYAGQFDRCFMNVQDEEAESYHRVMFDAFNYLKRYHKTGPGPDYLGSLTLFEPSPLEAEITSRLFWKRQIDRIREEEIEIQQKFY